MSFVADSSTPGFLAPGAAAPGVLEDDALDALLQQWVVGITGLDGTLVRPRWQPIPPIQPEASVNWAAIGILNRSKDYSASEWHQPGTPATGQQAAVPGSNLLLRQEELHLMATFYGPNCFAYAGIMADGMQLGQNNEVLAAHMMQIVESGDPVAVPELVNQQWIKRADLPITITRQVRRTYAVLDIDSASVGIATSDGTSP